MIRPPEHGKPIKLELDAGSDDESVKSGGGRGFAKNSKGSASVYTRTNRSLLGYAPIDVPQLEKNCTYITKWFSATISSGSMQTFPLDVVTQHGTQIYDLIQFLSGKRPPGQATAK